MLFVALNWSRPQIWKGGKGHFWGNGCRVQPSPAPVWSTFRAQVSGSIRREEERGTTERKTRFAQTSKLWKTQVRLSGTMLVHFHTFCVQSAQSVSQLVPGLLCNWDEFRCCSQNRVTFFEENKSKDKLWGFTVQRMHLPQTFHSKSIPKNEKTKRKHQSCEMSVTRMNWAIA